MSKYYAYIKRLGQKHFAESGESVTLCKRPMLGNNYARESLQGEIVGEIIPCQCCLKEMSKRDEKRTVLNEL